MYLCTVRPTKQSEKKPLFKFKIVYYIRIPRQFVLLTNTIAGMLVSNVDYFFLSSGILHMYNDNTITVPLSTSPRSDANVRYCAAIQK